MTKLDKLLTTSAFAALLAGGFAAVSQEAFAQAANPCAPKATKASNPCAPKAMSADSKDSGKSDMSRDKFDYPLLMPQMPGQNG